MHHHLPPWQDVVTIHPQLTENSADYAIHLSDVIQNAPQCPALYRNPADFFAATYPSTRLYQLFDDVHLALNGGDGARVLRLQSGFGGGKSHALLALYHWLTSHQEAQRQMGWTQLPTPPSTRLSAISGLDIDPLTGLQLTNAPTCQTLWGTMAWQLGGPEAYESFRSHDETRTAPGGQRLRRLLEPAPTLLLLDELVLYVEKTQGIALGDSTFGAQNVLFLQTLTEVIRGLPRAAMVYTLQATAAEAAGTTSVLDALVQLSQRLDTQRQPLAPEEIVQVLRRRLFRDVGPTEHHKAVADAYIASWQRYDAALGRRKQRYQQAHQTIVDSFPFHPALLALVAERWWELPTYQRTRGALQLLSQALSTAQNPHTKEALWSPASMPMTQQWRQKLMAQLGATQAHREAIEREFTTIATTDEPTPDITPEDIGEELLQAHQMRLLTTLCLHSFGGRGAATRGLLAPQCAQMCLLPDTHPVQLDVAWQRLQRRMGFLQQQQKRFKLAPTPNFRHILAEHRTQWSNLELEDALQHWLQHCFAAPNVHIWPSQPADIPDGIPALQWALLAPSWQDLPPAELAERLRQWVAQRTPHRPRQYRNGIAFLQPTQSRWRSLSQALAEWLSLRALSQDDTLLPKASQRRERDAYQQTLTQQLPMLTVQLYQTVWVPLLDREAPGGFRIESIDLSAWAADPSQPLQRYAEAMQRQHLLSTTMTPDKLIQLATTLLDSKREGTPTLPLPVLRDAFFAYLHFPRLPSLTPLNDTLATILTSNQCRLEGPWPTKRKQASDGWQEEPPVIMWFEEDDATPTVAPTSQDTKRDDDAAEGSTTPTLQLRIRTEANGSHWAALGTLLQRIQREKGAIDGQTSIEIQLTQAFDAMPAKRWLALVVEDTLEELGVDYDLNLSSQSGISMPCAINSKEKS